MSTETASALDDFAAGFSEGMEDSTSSQSFDAAPESKPESQESTDAPEVAETSVDEPTPEPEAEPEPEKPAAGISDLMNLLDQRLPKPAEKVEQAEPEPAAAKVEPLFTPEQEARLEELRSNWSEVNELLELQSKAQSDVIAKQVAEQVAAIKREMEAKIRPVEQVAAQTAQDKYNDIVKSVHPEVFDPKVGQQLGKDLVGWIESQPGYLKQAYIAAYNSTDPQDAIDLLARFKKESGKYTASKAPAPVDEVKQQRLKKMQQPASRPSSASEAADPSDFDGGFKEMAQALDQRRS
jgi:hypothetical protein